MILGPYALLHNSAAPIMIVLDQNISNLSSHCTHTISTINTINSLNQIQLLALRNRSVGGLIHSILLGAPLCIILGPVFPSGDLEHTGAQQPRAVDHHDQQGAQVDQNGMPELQVTWKCKEDKGTISAN